MSSNKHRSYPRDTHSHSGFQDTPIRAGIFGATGNTGVALANLLNDHPLVRLLFGTSRELDGQLLSDTDPSAHDLILTHPDTAIKESMDLAFLCLPHGASAQLAPDLRRQGTRVVDLSGDLRLRDETTHRITYGTPRDETVASIAVYGLPELNREEIRTAEVITNPGCYPTAVGLGLLPLAERGQLTGFVYVDAKSGVSGAGRTPTATTHFCSANEDVRPYNLGRTHRHVPEMEQTLQTAGGQECKVVFSPHLVPLERGILATCLVSNIEMDASRAHSLYVERYAGEPFVKVLPGGTPARIRNAAHTNRAVIGITEVPECNALIITSAIDNLGKGAAGQAVHNMNLMFGLPETTGLRGF